MDIYISILIKVSKKKEEEDGDDDNNIFFFGGRKHHLKFLKLFKHNVQN